MYRMNFFIIRNACQSFWNSVSCYLLSVWDYFLGRLATLSNVKKKCHKNERHLWCLVAHIFTKHSQNVNLINFDILICQMWLQVMERPWFYYVFRYFHTKFTTTHVRIIVFSPNFHKTMHTFWCVNMPNVTAGYGSFSCLIALLLRIFIYYYMFETL